MDILLVNPNTSKSMTEQITMSAQSVISPKTNLISTKTYCTEMPSVTLQRRKSALRRKNFKQTYLIGTKQECLYENVSVQLQQESSF